MKKFFILIILTFAVMLFEVHHHKFRGKEVVKKGKVATLKGELI